MNYLLSDLTGYIIALSLLNAKTKKRGKKNAK